MRNRLVGLLFVFVSAAALAEVPWQTFACPEGQFSVAGFGAPNVTVTHESTPLGTIDEHTYRWVRGPFECDVEYSDVPSLSTMGGGKLLFNQVSRGFKHDTGEPVKNERPWTCQGYTGRAFEFHRPKKPGQIAQSGMGRVLLVGSRLYVLVVTWDRDKPPASSADGDRFLDSFAPDTTTPTP